MTIVAKHVFNVQSRFEPTNRPSTALSKISSEQGLSEAEAKQYLDYIVYGTRSVLSKVLHEEFNQTQIAPDITTHPLHGRCSFSQCVSAYALQDDHLQPKPFSVQSLGKNHVGHASLVVELPMAEGTELFLIDPTYRQFCDPEVPTYENKPMPGYYLAQKDGGEKIITALLKDGYIKVTPDIAEKYLASFCEGVSPFKDSQAAMEYLQNPPYDNAYHHFDRNIMQEKGYLARSPNL